MNCISNYKKSGKFLFTLIFSLFFSIFSFASSNENKRELKPGKIIIDHISNSHEWHLMTLPSGTHVTVPLPVILYSSYTGFHIFMSSKFHHGHTKHKNFNLELEGDYKGKITEYNQAGQQLDKLPLDISMTKGVIGFLLGVIITMLVVRKAVKMSKEREGKSPKGIQNVVEFIIVFVRDDIAKSAIGHHYEKFMPMLLSFFFLIFTINLTGLIPIVPFGANVTGNISVTLALAIIVFFAINIHANKNYWKHIYNNPSVPWFLKFPLPIIPLIEFIQVFLKPLVLAVRLFANIMAGHIVILAFISLIFIIANISPVAGGAVSIFSLIFVLFISVLELLVALIQAFVFTLLTAIFIGLAVEEHP